MAERHYSQTAPSNTQYAFEMVNVDGHRVGLILFGPPSRKQAIDKYPGYIELTRLWVSDECPKNSESYLIGYTLRWLKNNTDLAGVLSYADPNVGHQGVIYRASNFKFDGKTAPGYHYVNKDGVRVHIRQVWERARTASQEVPGWSERDQAEVEGLKRVDDKNGKHRFIYDFKKTKAPEYKNVEKDRKLISFFQTQTPQSLWVYGLIIGDGNVHSDGAGGYRVSIVGNDDTVEKVLKLIPGSLSKRFGKNKRVRDWYVNSKALVEWFSERGVIGKKKYIKNLYPGDISPDLKWHFLRGLIDSDGSFCWDTRYGHTFLSLGFSSSNQEFANRVLAEMSPESEVSVRSSVSNGFDHYAFKFSESKSIEILDKIYDCDQSIRNEERYRKYLIGKRLFEQWNQRKCKVCGEPGFDSEYCYTHMMEIKREQKVRDNRCSVSNCDRPYHGSGVCMYHFWEKRNQENPLRNPEIGRRVSELRKRHGVSQLALSIEVLGHRGNGHLSNVEKGVSFLSEENIEKISARFQVSKEWLLYG